MTNTELYKSAQSEITFMDEKLGNLKELKEGSYVMVDGEPCKVTKVELSKPGKHGSAKARIEAVGIFDDKKRSIMKPADSDCSIPVIEKRTGQVVSVVGNMVQLMDMSDYSTFEATLPDELRAKAQPGTEIGYWKFGTKILLKN